MDPILIFTFIIVFALIPFGFAVVWTLYRNTVVFSTAMTVFITSMGVGIVAFSIGNKGSGEFRRAFSGWLALIL
jgi:hypothetical protein